MIRNFLKAYIPTLSLKKGVDYRITESSLWVKDSNAKQKIQKALSKAFPEEYFYSESSKTLSWS